MLIRLLLDYYRLSEVGLLQVVAIAYKTTGLVMMSETSLGSLVLLVLCTYMLLLLIHV